MAGPEKTIQNKSLDKFKTKFDMTQTQAPQLRRSMTIPGQLQEQEKEQEESIIDDFESIEKSDSLSSIGDEPPAEPEYIGFDRKFAAYRKDDGERMIKVRDALSKYFENKDKGEEDPENLKEIISACSDYGRFRFAIFKGERAAQRLKEIERLKHRAEDELEDYTLQNMAKYGNLAMVEHHASFDEDNITQPELAPPGFVTYTIGYSRKKPFTTISIPFWVLNDKGGKLKYLNRKLYEERQKRRAMEDDDEEESVVSEKEPVEKKEEKKEEKKVIENKEEDQEAKKLREEIEKNIQEEEERKRKNEILREQARIEQENLAKKKREEDKKKEELKKKEEKEKEELRKKEDKKKEELKKKEEKEKEELRKKEEKEKEELRKKEEKEKEELRKKRDEELRREREDEEFKEQIERAKKESLDEIERNKKNMKENAKTLDEAIKKDLKASEERVDTAFKETQEYIKKHGSKVMQKGKKDGDVEPGYEILALDEAYQENFTNKDKNLFGPYDEIKPEQVTEVKNIDNCYMIAALAALALKDPDYIRNTLITNDEKHPDDYAVVRLYDNSGQMQRIVVQKTKQDKGRALWVELVEKAACVLLTRFNGATGYRQGEVNNPLVGSLSRSGDLQLGSEELVCRLLFGRKGKLITTRAEEHAAYDKKGMAKQLLCSKGDEAIGQALAYAQAGKCVIASTCTNGGSQYYNSVADSVKFPVNLQQTHEYTVFGEGKKINGQRTIRLKDAKKGDTFDLTFGYFKTIFTDIHISGHEER